MNNFYKLSGLIGFLVAWFGMLLVVHTQGRDRSKSISLHVASSKRTFILLAFLSPVSMSLFMVFVVKWVAPLLEMPSVFALLCIVSFSGYILAAWFPAIEGIKGTLHDIFAYVASLLLIPISLILATTQNISALPRVMNTSTFLLMLAILVLMYISKGERSRFLYLEIAYFLAFDISLLAAGYIH